MIHIKRPDFFCNKNWNPIWRKKTHPTLPRVFRWYQVAQKTLYIYTYTITLDGCHLLGVCEADVWMEVSHAHLAVNVKAVNHGSQRAQVKLCSKLRAFCQQKITVLFLLVQSNPNPTHPTEFEFCVLDILPVFGCQCHDPMGLDPMNCWIRLQSEDNFAQMLIRSCGLLIRGCQSYQKLVS